MSTYTPVPLKDLDHNNPYHSNAGGPLPSTGPSRPPFDDQGESRLTRATQLLRKYSAPIEALIENLSRPVKPHLNKLARFLLVSTFLEDALRISNQFYEQKEYLIDDQEYHDWFVVGFLAANVILMVVCSILIIFKKWALFSVLGLVGVIVAQGWVYDLLTDGTFVCLNLSIMGALMLAISDSIVSKSVGGSVRGMAGLPDISEDVARKRRTYLQLSGRILLVVFFVGHALAAYLELAFDSFSFLHLAAAALAVLACLLVAVGFKAAWSATFLVILTSVVNVLSNDWWSKPKDHPERDFRRGGCKQKGVQLDGAKQ
ncbi:surfeit locus protein [Puccinia graminis f. sp. tritici]|uniref:Surfeit locus protein n=1 Tax=Puccinia graminis f. sp. tritici TaxID=56615 RepID=A0A5B0PKU6_PUCGR|nr:surfeit locus protein [Puccinia graminis f. sp. tritici]